MPACTGPLSCRRWSRCSSPPSRSRTGPTPGAHRAADRRLQPRPRFRGAARRSRSSLQGIAARVPRPHARLGRRRRARATACQRLFERPPRSAATASVHGPPRRRRAATATSQRGRDARPGSRRAGSSCSPTATRAGPARPSSPAPRRCSSWRACSKSRDLRQDARARLHLGRPAAASRARAPGRARGRRPVDAVLVLGDMAGTRLRSHGSSPGPTATRRRSGCGAPSRPPSGGGRRRPRRPPRARAVGAPRAPARRSPSRARSARRAPRGPARPVRASRARRPRDGRSQDRLGAFGRAALRTVGAIDAAGPRARARRPFAGEPAGSSRCARSCRTGRCGC